MKLKEGKTNTHGAYTQGALVFSGLQGATEAPVFMRFTSDNVGETLSLESRGIMIVIPYEPLKALIKETRGKDGGGA